MCFLVKHRHSASCSNSRFCCTSHEDSVLKTSLAGLFGLHAYLCLTVPSSEKLFAATPACSLPVIDRYILTRAENISISHISDSRLKGLGSRGTPAWLWGSISGCVSVLVLSGTPLSLSSSSLPVRATSFS